MRIVIYTSTVLKCYLWKRLFIINSSSFTSRLSQYDHAIVLFLSCLLLFVEYFNWMTSFLWSPNTNLRFLLWFIVCCQGLAVALFQIHLVSRCGGRSQQLFFFGHGEGKEKGKWGVTGCCGEDIISQSSHRVQGDRRHVEDDAGSFASL